MLGALALLVLTQTGPVDAGWSVLPNTKLRPVCPGGDYGCANVMAAWNSAAFDSVRNRLLIFGGGHSDYDGNEIYALELGQSPPAMVRLTDPTANTSNPSCGTTYTDGKPVSRHTYDGLAYIAHADRLALFGGSKWQCGYIDNDTWTFNFQTSTWQDMKPSGTPPDATPGFCTAYDPVTKKVYLHNQAGLYAYDFDTNHWEQKAGQYIDYHLNGVIDLHARRFYVVGSDTMVAYDLEGPQAFMPRTLQTTGGGPVISAGYPGLTYDSTQQKLVAWVGGNTVYAFDDSTNTWLQSTAPGGFPMAQPNGTYDRFSYVPAWNGFVLVNASDQDARFYRIGPPPSAYDPGVLPDGGAGTVDGGNGSPVPSTCGCHAAPGSMLALLALGGFRRRRGFAHSSRGTASF